MDINSCEASNLSDSFVNYDRRFEDQLTYDWMESFLNEAKLEIDEFIEEKQELDLTRRFSRVRVTSDQIDASDDPKVICKYIDDCMSNALNELDSEFMDFESPHARTQSVPVSPPLPFRDASPIRMMTTSSSESASISPIAGLAKSDVSEYCSPHSSPSLNYRDTGSLKSVDIELLNGHSSGSLLTKYNQRESPINQLISNYHRNSYYDNNDEVSLNLLSASQIERIINYYKPNTNTCSVNEKAKRNVLSSSYNLFGCDINVVERMNGGLTLPPFIENALIYLLRYGINSVGIFRKSGVKSRISALRRKLETLTTGRKVFSSPVSSSSPAFAFNSGSLGEDYCVYDIADMVKCWLRELKPTPLINKEIINAFKESKTKTDVHSRLAVCLLTSLTDSQRSVLEIILQFLSWFASNSNVNQMNAHNLAICLTPSLCECDGSQLQPSQSPSDSCGVETEFLYDAQKCLEYLIENCDVLSVISLNCLPSATNDESSQESRTPDAQYSGPLHDWSPPNGASSFPSPSLFTNNTLPPKHQSVIVINASPVDILKRVLYQRNLFDPTITEWNIIEDNPTENSDVFAFKTQSSVFLPIKNFTIERRWKFVNRCSKDSLSSSSASNRKSDSCVTNGIILEESGHLYESCWKIGVFGEGKSLLEHTIASDYRGHSYEWYSQTFPDIHDTQLHNLNQSFLVDIIETKNMKSSEV